MAEPAGKDTPTVVPAPGDLDGISVCIRISGCAEPGFEEFNTNLECVMLRNDRPCFQGHGVLLYYSASFWRLAKSEDPWFTGWNYSQAAGSDPRMPPSGRWLRVRASPSEERRDYSGLTVAICTALRLPGGIAEDFGRLLDSGVDSDVSLQTQGRLFAVHGLVLKARSTVFRKMLESPMREATSRNIFVEDVDAATMDSLLRYVYTGMVPARTMADHDQVLSLMEAAHHFGFDELCAGCAERLEMLLEVENACNILQAADMFGCDRLRQSCLAHIVQHLAEVQSTSGYEALATKRPILLRDIIATLAPPASRKRKADALCTCL